ncbi:SWIM zinc finger family protein [bacterium]|nr:SWIM zinc finger family protein [bacterium]
MGGWRWDDDGYRPRFEKKLARQVKDGLKVEKKIGGTWWSSRWIGVLESFDMGARLARGRTYARRGQVIDIDIGAGVVRSRVQGSRRTPYAVKLQIQPLSDASWEKIFKALASQALFAAKLLAGEMPQAIEEAFSAVGASLFPKRIDDLQTVCSCPDWANPCKHIAAVYYVLGDRFDDDPFLIFALRGRDEKQVIEALRKLRKTDSGDAPAVIAEPGHASIEEPATPISTDPDRFWRLGEDIEGLTYEPVLPETPEAALLILGPCPKPIGGEQLVECLKPAYMDRPPARILRVIVKSEAKIVSTQKRLPALGDPLLQELAGKLPEPLRKTHLGTMKLPARLTNILMANRIHTIEEILQFEAANFLKFQGVGGKTLRDMVIELQYFLQKRMNT